MNLLKLCKVRWLFATLLSIAAAAPVAQATTNQLLIASPNIFGISNDTSPYDEVVFNGGNLTLNAPMYLSSPAAINWAVNANQIYGNVGSYPFYVGTQKYYVINDNNFTNAQTALNYFYADFSYNDGDAFASVGENTTVIWAASLLKLREAINNTYEFRTTNANAYLLDGRTLRQLAAYGIGNGQTAYFADPYSIYHTVTFDSGSSALVLNS